MKIIESAVTAEIDIELKKNLAEFNSSKGAPNYNPISRSFSMMSDDGKTLGTAVVSIYWGIAQLNTLFVCEDCRGKGIGKKLVYAVEGFARANHALGIRIWAPTWQGVGFYELCGYKELVRVPFNTVGYFNDQPQFHVLYWKSF